MRIYRHATRPGTSMENSPPARRAANPLVLVALFTLLALAICAFFVGYSIDKVRYSEQQTFLIVFMICFSFAALFAFWRIAVKHRLLHEPTRDVSPPSSPVTRSIND